MSEETRTKRQEVKPGPKLPRLKRGAFIELGGFPYPITNELLQGPKGEMHIRAIQNWERENNMRVLGTLIVTD